MTYVFESKVPTLTFEINPARVKDGKEVGKSQSVQFRGHYLMTDKEEVAKKIMASSMYGQDDDKLIWLRIKSEDEQEIAQAQAPKRRGSQKKFVRGAVGTS